MNYYVYRKPTEGVMDVCLEWDDPEKETVNFTLTDQEAIGLADALDEAMPEPPSHEAVRRAAEG